VLPVAMAGVAVLLALVSIVIALRATGRAQDAQDRLDRVLAGGVGNPVPTTEPPAPTSEATDESTPTDAPSTVGPEAPPTAPAAKYTSAYTNQTLQLQASCNYNLYIDLDDPRVLVSQGSKDDLTYTQGCADPSTFSLSSGVLGSTTDSPTIQPWECADRIRSSPIALNLDIPARKGVVLCVLTSQSAAQEQGIKQRMVVLEVTGEGKDGKVVVKATAWNVPN
jgi:hypothetical protein